MTARTLCGVLVLLFTANGVAQAPHEDWRTITTEHYRVHYPRDYEAWSRHAAGKLEEIRARITPIVGYEPSEVTDVIVADPLALPNGSAWPLLGTPRMVLWTSPPEPGSVLSNYSDWGELVVIHEDAHLVHLLRPTRNPLRALGWYLLPVRLGPVTYAPRWVTEGYATLIEGQLTGRGRPHSDLRASILRRWAQAGRLPTYDRLASDSSTWLGQSMAYLVGSAYLEWLLEREGEGSLRDLWARVTARRSRSFDEAFEGVYGDSPRRLYERFTAELTQRAMTVELALTSSMQEGELWQDFAWFTGVPDLALDGSLMVTVRRPKEGPATMAVFSTEPDNESEEKWKKRIDEMLGEDPYDVAPVRRRPFPRRPMYRLTRRSGAVPRNPRWINGTGHVLFGELVPDRNGFMHSDLFRWNPKTNEVWRLTVAADLRDADPMAKGAEAVAVRNRYGRSQLVRVNFASLEVVGLTPESISEVYASPRVSPDEDLLAYVVKRDERWQLVVRDLESGEESIQAFAGTVAHPDWSPDGATLFCTVGTDGFLEIWAFPVRDGRLAAGRQLTRGATAFFGPAAGRDEVYFLGMDPDGIDVRRLDLTMVQAPLSVLDLPSTLAPAVRVVPKAVRPAIESSVVGEGRPYGWGRPEASPIFGGSWASSGGTFEIGARLGDVVGRTEAIAIGSLSDGGAARGGLLSGVSKRWPIHVSAQVFSVEERASEQSFDDGSSAVVMDRERVGVEVEGSKSFYWRAAKLTIGAGAYGGSIESAVDDAVDQWGAQARVHYSGRPTSGPWSYPVEAGFAIAKGSTDGRSFFRVVGDLSFGVMRKGNGAEIEVGRGDVGDDTHPIDRFEVGGLRTTLHGGPGAFGNRVWAAGLPYGSLEGSSYTRLRGALLTSFLPAKLFYERIDTATGRSDDSIDYAGIEIELNVDGMPIIRIPNLTITAGVSMAFDPPVEDEVHGWVGLRWNP